MCVLHVFDAVVPLSTNFSALHDVFVVVRICFFLPGYNACVFAYGATGGGKTHTMVGVPGDEGCMVLALNDLFGAMDDHSESNFKVGAKAETPWKNTKI